jgi:hypothetical protein
VFAKAVDPAHAELIALTSGLYHEPRLFSSGVVSRWRGAATSRSTSATSCRAR